MFFLFFFFIVVVCIIFLFTTNKHAQKLFFLPVIFYSKLTQFTNGHHQQKKKWKGKESIDLHYQQDRHQSEYACDRTERLIIRSVSLLLISLPSSSSSSSSSLFASPCCDVALERPLRECALDLAVDSLGVRMSLKSILIPCTRKFSTETSNTIKRMNETKGDAATISHMDAE
jgi:hypothetical protein